MLYWIYFLVCDSYNCQLGYLDMLLVDGTYVKFQVACDVNVWISVF